MLMLKFDLLAFSKLFLLIPKFNKLLLNLPYRTKLKIKN